MKEGASLEATVRRLADVRRSADWPAWQELCRDAPPFLSPEFFALTARLSEGEPVVATASQGGRLVGALPLVRCGKILHRLGSSHTPYFDYCGTAEGLAAIWRALRRVRGWSELFLEEVPAESLLATQLPAIAGADRSPAVLRPAERNLYLSLPGFEARLHQRFRMNLHRTERKAGRVELERIARPTHADFTEAVAIEAMAWKGAAGSSIAASPRVAHLYATLGRQLGRRGRAHLCFLRVEGRRIAMVLTVEDARTLYALKVGYDPQHAAIGPGHLLFWKLAADAEARGLVELDFLGHASEWKQKWSDQAHGLVSVRVYRRSLRGLTRYGLREVVKPRLPENMRDLRFPLRRGCQRTDIIGVHTFKSRIRGPLVHGLLLGQSLLRDVRRGGPPRELQGAPSRFEPGAVVRVLDAERVRATLDAGKRTRGLKFMDEQYPYCGREFRVQRVMRRMRDDEGRARPISRTVLLEGLTCVGEGPRPQGCGRYCPTMWRDEWLEAVQRPGQLPPPPKPSGHARVRKMADIVKGLDLQGRRDGLTFMPEMEGYVGRRLPIVELIPKLKEWDRWVDPQGPFYVLAGAQCSGAYLGKAAPCDRACALLWHGDWLLVEGAEGAAGGAAGSAAGQ